MPICRCWQCGYEKKVDSLEEARRLARLHMSGIGCIMVFGYSDVAYREALGLDEMSDGDSCEPYCEVCNQYKCVCEKNGITKSEIRLGERMDD